MEARWNIIARLPHLLRRLGWFYGLVLALSAFSLWIFVEVAEETLEKETLTINREVLLAVHGHAHPVGDGIALALAAIGSPWGITLTGLAFGGWLYRQRRLLDLFTLVIALVGCAVLTFVLKAAYHQARPELFPRLVAESTYSFPSGHASMALCLYGFFAGWLVVQAPRERWRWLLGSMGVAFAVSIGLSRLYLGVHWPTDVLAGMALAIFWLAVCLIGRRWFASRAPGKP